MKSLATTDGLTGVINRTGFNHKMAEAYELAVRYERPLSVILLDVDQFKLFNDSFGHPAGDEVLKTVAVTLQKSTRAIDTVVRYGGEEFAIILPETDFAGAMILAERCRRAIAEAPWTKRSITVSAGVASLTSATADAAGLLSEADEALYCSKETGRNRVSVANRSSHLLTSVGCGIRSLEPASAIAHAPG